MPHLFPIYQYLPLFFLHQQSITCFFQKLRNGDGWSNSHYLWRATFYNIINKFGYNGHLQFFSNRPSSKEHRCCTIWNLWTIASSSVSIFFKSSLKLWQPFNWSLFTNSIIFFHDYFFRYSFLILNFGFYFNNFIYILLALLL